MRSFCYWRCYLNELYVKLNGEMVYANVHDHFSFERHIIERQTCRERCSAALAEWQVLAS